MLIHPARALVTMLVMVAAASASAQGFPSQTIQMVSPFPPGSGSDLVARAVAPGLGEALGQPVIVQNRAGAGGAIGAAAVAKAKPDGYTVFLASLSFSILPALQDLPFDPIRDFEAVSLLGQQGMAFMAPASLPANNMAEFTALAKSQPGRLNYASAGIGSIGHLAGELLKTERSLSIVHVPYKGTPDVLAAIIAGDAQLGMVAMPAAEPQIRAGKVKALAVTGAKREAVLPDVPTMIESGFPSISDSVWYIVLVPAGTPRAVIDRLNAALRQALANPVTLRLLEGSARTSPATSTPQEAAAYLRAQVAKWGRVAAQAGLKTQAAK